MITRREFLAGTAAAAALSSCKSTPPYSPSMDGESEWVRIRETEFMLDPTIRHLNTGTLGAMPKPVLKATEERRLALARDPMVYCTGEKNYFTETEELRKIVAEYLNCGPDEIAFTRNSSESINVIASGLDLAAGDEVLLTDHEHGANVFPWQQKERRSGVKIVRVPMPVPLDPMEFLKRVEGAITAKTRLIAFAHIMSTNGARIPLEELTHLAHSRGIWVMGDGAQAVGMIKVDLRALGVDFYLNSPHKWLGTAQGTGLLFVRRELQEKVWPLIAGGGYDAKRGAANYDALGTRNWAETLAIKEALEFQDRIGGIEAIERRDLELASELKAKLARIPKVKVLSSTDPGLSSALSTFAIEGMEDKKLWTELFTRFRCRTRHMPELKGIRVSTHYYNTRSEIEALVGAVEELSRLGLRWGPKEERFARLVRPDWTRLG
jgi:L-cysteine/cystine lyase